jgi:molybdate transport system substrate-binding protein
MDYAIGRLVRWAPSSAGSDSARATLESGQFRRLALANPKLAPYGRAAQEVLEALGVRDQLVPGQIISGENVAQAYQFVATGNVTFGFVALSQVLDLAPDQYWVIPQQYYAPIVQQLVVLNQSVAAIAFIEFFSTSQVQSILQSQGYRLPQTD